MSSIDLNEQPEPTEEYPSHMVEETADEEEITDHQTVADILTNGELYEGLTEERLRDVVEEVLGEADEEVVQAIREEETVQEAIERVEDLSEPEHTVQDVRDSLVTRIDVSQIPAGVTLHDAVEHYRNTGVMITTNATDGMTYVADTSSTTDSLDAEMMATVERLVSSGEVKVDEEKGEEIVRDDESQKEPVMEETAKQIRARMRKADPLQYRIDAQHHLSVKRSNVFANLNKKRKSSMYLAVKDISPNDLVFGSRGEMFHHTYVEPLRAKAARIQSTLAFDKNFNLISVFQGAPYSKRRRRNAEVCEDRIGHRVNKAQLSGNIMRGNPMITKFFTINKEVFIKSSGRDFEYRMRGEIPVSEMLKVKKDSKDAFKKMEDAMELVISGVESVFLPDDFDVFYEFNNFTGLNYMTVLLKFKDVTITNSIEMSRNIGDILIKLRIEHDMYHSTEKKIRLRFMSDVSGRRMTYSSIDAVAGYQHSHIPSGLNQYFSGMCTGGESYALDNPNQTEIEALMYKIQGFVQWESLEGGPHYRMENIPSGGQKYSLKFNGKSMSLPSPTYIRNVIGHINKTKEGFDTFKHCFTLRKKGSELIFIVDHKRFYLEMMDMFDKDTVTSLNRLYQDYKYFYKPEINQFYRISRTTHGSAEAIKRDAIQNVAATRPIYMNGRFIKPTVIKYVDPFEGTRFCINPEIMHEIANVILYHLTEKLENYGNTSERQTTSEAG